MEVLNTDPRQLSPLNLAFIGDCVYEMQVRCHLVALAKQLGLPYQIEIFPGIGTDAGEMHKEKAGVPTGVISIPSRYAHCPHEVIDWGDLDQCKQLLAAFLQSMEENTSFPGESRAGEKEKRHLRVSFFFGYG